MTLKKRLLSRATLAGVGIAVPAVLAVTVIAGAAPPETLAAAPCTAAGKSVLIRTHSATVYCGPARATVRLGGRTMTFNSGTCVWTPSLFKVQLGTIFLFRNFARERGFEIRASGYPVARALIQVYWDGAYYEAGTLHATARPNGSSTGGTFSGKTGRNGTGPSISGTISCS